MDAEQTRDKTKRVFDIQAKQTTDICFSGNSVGQFCRHLRPTLINYDSNLGVCGTFLIERLKPSDGNTPHAPHLHAALRAHGTAVRASPTPAEGFRVSLSIKKATNGEIADF